MVASKTDIDGSSVLRKRMEFGGISNSEEDDVTAGATMERRREELGMSGNGQADDGDWRW